MIKINKIFSIFLVLSSIVVMNSCTTEDLNPSLEQNKDFEKALTKVENLNGLLNGVYSSLTSSPYYGRDMIINCEVRTDNCYSNANSGRFSTQAALKYNSYTGFLWSTAYGAISGANTVIAADLSKLKGDKNYGMYLQGQAYALRALMHFDLLAIYGQQHVGGTLGVPYMTKPTTKDSPESDFNPARNSVTEVRDMVFADLDKAYKLMTTGDAVNYDNPGNKEFLSSYAVKALEARFALYFGMWKKASDAAAIVVNSGRYDVMTPALYVKSWTSKQNSNSVFELAFNATDNLGINGLAYIYRVLPSGSGYGDVSAVYPSVAAMYVDGDVRADILGVQRISRATRLVNAFKYPNMQGENNVPLIRIEEVILTYAEALFEQGQTAEALAELNKIATNRGLEAYTAVDKATILLERRRELVFEGFRFNDLVRNGMGIYSADDAGNITPVPYGDYRLAWPIPQHEMDANAKMVQNEGY